MFFLRAGGGLIWVNRGDAGAVDLAFASMTVDSIYHEWDMSGIIDAGAKLVMLRLWRFKAATAGQRLQIRPKGGEDEYNTASITTQSGNNDEYFTMFVRPDADGIIEYKLTAPMTNCNFVIAGWFV